MQVGAYIRRVDGGRNGGAEERRRVAKSRSAHRVNKVLNFRKSPALLLSLPSRERFASAGGGGGGGGASTICIIYL